MYIIRQPRIIEFLSGNYVIKKFRCSFNWNKSYKTKIIKGIFLLEYLSNFDGFSGQFEHLDIIYLLCHGV